MSDNALGTTLKKLRKASGYTQEFVASQLNVIFQTYSHYETGRILPPTDALYQLARLYGIPIDSLLKLTIPPQIYADYIAAQSATMYLDEDFSIFLDFVEADSNKSKLKGLDRREKELICYFQQLNTAAQEEAIDILKVKCFHSRKKKAPL